MSVHWNRRTGNYRVQINIQAGTCETREEAEQRNAAAYELAKPLREQMRKMGWLRRHGGPRKGPQWKATRDNP